MNSQQSSASNHTPSQPTKPTTLWVSSQLTRSEIDSLRQSKKSIADYVQKALPERLAKLSDRKQQVTA
jgi:hypothetical protein